jgi:hypothetical protein
VDSAEAVAYLGAAVGVAMDFWSALANDDNEVLAGLLAGEWPDPPSSFAAQYREARDLAPETCRVLGLVSYADVLGPGRLRLFFSPAEASTRFEVGVPQVVWRLEVVDEDGQWRVGRSSDIARVERIDLTPLFSAAGLPLGGKPPPRIH